MTAVNQGSTVAAVPQGSGDAESPRTVSAPAATSAVAGQPGSTDAGRHPGSGRRGFPSRPISDATAIPCRPRPPPCAAVRMSATWWSRAGTAFEEYRQGVPGAIDTLVRLVSPLLWHTARQCGLTAAESEDVVQQTFLSLVRSKDSVSDPLAVVRWLTVSLRRLAWRERANSAKRSNEEPTDDDLPRAPRPSTRRC